MSSRAPSGDRAVGVSASAAASGELPRTRPADWATAGARACREHACAATARRLGLALGRARLSAAAAGGARGDDLLPHLRTRPGAGVGCGDRSPTRCTRSGCRSSWWRSWCRSTRSSGSAWRCCIERGRFSGKGAARAAAWTCRSRSRRSSWGWRSCSCTDAPAGLATGLPTHGIQVIFSVPGMVLATAFVSLPFVARETVPVLHELGTDAEQAAATLGRKRLADVPAGHACPRSAGASYTGSCSRPPARLASSGL